MASDLHPSAVVHLECKIQPSLVPTASELVSPGCVRLQDNYNLGITVPPQHVMQLETLVDVMNDDQKLERYWQELNCAVRGLDDFPADGKLDCVLTVRPCANCGDEGVAKLLCAEDLVSFP